MFEYYQELRKLVKPSIGMEFRDRLKENLRFTKLLLTERKNFDQIVRERSKEIVKTNYHKIIKVLKAYWRYGTKSRNAPKIIATLTEKEKKILEDMKDYEKEYRNIMEQEMEPYKKNPNMQATMPISEEIDERKKIKVVMDLIIQKSNESREAVKQERIEQIEKIKEDQRLQMEQLAKEVPFDDIVETSSITIVPSNSTGTSTAPPETMTSATTTKASTTPPATTEIATTTEVTIMPYQWQFSHYIDKHAALSKEITAWEAELIKRRMDNFIVFEDTVRDVLKAYVLEKKLEKKLKFNRRDKQMEVVLKVSLDQLRQKRPKAYPKNAAGACKFSNLLYKMQEIGYQRTGREIKNALKELMFYPKNGEFSKQLIEAVKTVKETDLEILPEEEACDGARLESRLDSSRVEQVLGPWIEGDRYERYVHELTDRERRLIKECKSLSYVYDNEIEKQLAERLRRLEPGNVTGPIAVDDSLRLVLQKVDYLKEAFQDSNKIVMTQITDLRSRRNLNMLGFIRSICRVNVIRNLITKFPMQDSYGWTFLKEQLKKQEELVDFYKKKTETSMINRWTVTYKFKQTPYIALKTEVDQELANLLKGSNGTERQKHFKAEVNLVKGTNFTKMMEDTLQKMGEIINDEKFDPLQKLHDMFMKKQDLHESPEYFRLTNLMGNSNQPMTSTEIKNEIEEYEKELLNKIRATSQAEYLTLTMAKEYFTTNGFDRAMLDINSKRDDGMIHFLKEY